MTLCWSLGYEFDNCSSCIGRNIARVNTIEVCGPNLHQRPTSNTICLQELVTIVHNLRNLVLRDYLYEEDQSGIV